MQGIFSKSLFFFSFTQGLEIPNTTPVVHLRRPQNHHHHQNHHTSFASSSDRTSSYRFSMANLEETHEAELDAILGELSLLEQKNPLNPQNNTASGGINTIIIAANTNSSINDHLMLRNAGMVGRTHSRSNSTISAVTNSTISSFSTSSESGTGSGSDTSGGSTALREPRTDSPDNDSAFSDTVSLLSSESSASSGVSSSAAIAKNHHLPLHSNLLQVSVVRQKLVYFKI